MAAKIEAVGDQAPPRDAARERVLAFPDHHRPHARRRAAAWLPSGRSLAVGFTALAVAAGVYFAARETSMFALQTVEVRGARPAVAARVRSTLEPLLGTSLTTFDPVAANRLLAALPDVAAATYDRDFPHTLRVFVRAENGVAILRQGADAWLASSRARVLSHLSQRPFPTLPRVWLPASTSVEVGQTLDGASAQAVRTLAVVRRLGFPGAIQKTQADDDELTLVLRSGLQVRLGDTADLPLKLGIARRIIPLAQGAGYVDVSVPERPVAGFDSQVSG